MTVTRRLLALVAVVVGCLAVVVVWLYPSRADFNPANISWNGLSGFAGEYRIIPLPSLVPLPAHDSGGNVLVIIPYRPVSRADTARIKRFLETDGVVMLLDDFGFGNQVLAGVGLSARFAGAALLDPLFHYKNRWLPKIITVPLLPSGGTLILNHATALAKTSGMTVIAQSSAYAFLDLNRNGRADPGEPGGPLPVAAWERVGGGVLVAVADPSLLVNSMLDLGENREFVRRVLHLAGEHPRVFLDEGHLPMTRLDRAKVALRSARAAITTVPVLLMLLLAGIMGPLVTLFREEPSNAGSR